MALRTGYDTGTYSDGKYGYPQVFLAASAVSVTSVVSQADSRIVRLGDAAASVSASVTVSGQKLHDGAVSDTSSVSATAAGTAILLANSADTTTVGVEINCIRILPFSAAVATSGSVTQKDSRYKWIPITEPSDTWTQADYRGN